MGKILSGSSVLLYRLISSILLNVKLSLLRLILKKGDRQDHKNWRPISPLNLDYKLCDRVLAGRLLKVISKAVTL